jgi:hypothetical protein
MESKWIIEEDYWLVKAIEVFRVPKEYFGEGKKTYQQIENEKLWMKLRRKLK